MRYHLRRSIFQTILCRSRSLYDYRDERAVVKFANMDLIGIPWQIVVGPIGLGNKTVDVKNRATGEKEEMTPDAVLNKLTAG